MEAALWTNLFHSFNKNNRKEVFLKALFAREVNILFSYIFFLSEDKEEIIWFQSILTVV